MDLSNSILRLEAPKIVQKVIGIDGETYCMVRRQGIIAHQLSIRKATREEIGKIMD